MNSLLDSLDSHQRTALGRHLQMRYHRQNPVAWCSDVMDEFLWSKQREVAMAIADERLVAVRAAHSVGKSMVAARIALWFVMVHPVKDVKVVVTASSQKQLETVLWPEMRQAHARAGLPGTFTDDEWKIDGYGVAVARKPADHNAIAIQGIHRRHLLVIIDEACGVSQELWEACDSLASNSGRILALGNPEDPVSRFAAVSAPGSGWRSIRIDALESPNFTDEVVPAHLHEVLITRQWAAEKAREYTEDSNFYQVRVRGEFPEEGESSLIQASWVRDAFDRYDEGSDDLSEALTLGVDVGYGISETVIVSRRGMRCRIECAWVDRNTMATAGRIASMYRDLSVEAVHVDANGVGTGVVDALRERGIKVQGLVGSVAALDKESFVRARAERYWALRQGLQEGLIEVKRDNELARQLLSLQFSYDSAGRIAIEPKEQARSRGAGKLDRVDALVLSLPDHRDRQLKVQRIVAREQLLTHKARSGWNKEGRMRELNALPQAELDRIDHEVDPRTRLGDPTLRIRQVPYRLGSPFGLGRSGWGTGR